jgi:hypothetical protein
VLAHALAKEHRYDQAKQGGYADRDQENGEIRVHDG